MVMVMLFAALAGGAAGAALTEREMRQNAQNALQDERAFYHEDRKRLQKQVQDMAERIASLRQEGLSEGGDTGFLPEQKPETPYSAELILEMVSEGTAL